MDPVKARRRRFVEIKDALRDTGIQLSLLNQRVGARLELRGVDLEVLNLISRHGPISPTALAGRARLHPATLTGILDRLERQSWIARQPDPADRRAIRVAQLPDRTSALVALLAGMNRAMDEVLDGYDDDELDVIADFLRRTTDAGRRATDDLV